MVHRAGAGIPPRFWTCRTPLQHVSFCPCPFVCAVDGLAGYALHPGAAFEPSGTDLTAGAQDILKVALDAGYGSHEAFTRAFCDLFGLTPKQVREHEDEPLSLV